MEARFEVVAACTQEGYRVLNENVQKKQKSGRALVVFAVLLGVLAVINAFVMDVPAMILMLFLCALISLMYVLMPRSAAAASWKARNTALGISPITYRFDDTYMYTNHPLTAETNDYRLLMDVVETEEYFLLYVNGVGAYILPKAAFAVGTPDEFRQFLMQKTGRPITPYLAKKQRKSRLVTAILVPTVALLLALIICLLGLVDHTVTTTSADGRESLSIDVPLYLTWDEYPAGYNCLYSDDVAIYVEHYSTTDLREMLPSGTVTSEAFEQYLTDTSYAGGDGVWFEDGQGARCIGFYQDDYFYDVHLFWTDEACFLVTFCCDSEMRGVYADEFAEWRGSITVEVAA